MGEDRTTIAEGFLEVVDSFVDTVEHDRYLTVLLRCSDVARLKDGVVIVRDAERGSRVAVASSPFVLGFQDRRSALERDSVRAAFDDGVACSRQFLPSDIIHDPYAGEALNLGFHHEYVYPLNFRDNVMGAVVLLDRNEHPIDTGLDGAARSMASVAGTMMQHARVTALSNALVGHLQTALDSRVIVEQAKGVIAGRHGHDMDTAFRVLRTKARNERRAIADVARDVIAGG